MYRMFLWNGNIHTDSEFRLIIDINNCGETATPLWNTAVIEALGSKVEPKLSAQFHFQYFHSSWGCQVSVQTFIYLFV